MRNFNEHIGETTLVYGTCQCDFYTRTHIVGFERITLYVFRGYSLGSGTVLLQDHMWHVLMWFDKRGERWV